MKFLIIPILATVLLMTSCGSKNNFALFSGEIKSTDITELYLISGIDTLVFDVIDGKFSDTVRNLNAYYYVRLGNIEATLFFEAGDEVEMTFNSNSSLEGLNFSGKGSEKNNFLVFKSKEISDESIDFAALFGKAENDFKQSVDLIFDGIRKEFERANLTSNFKKTEAKSIDYLYYNMLRAYPSYHPYVTNNPDFVLSENFFPKAYTDLDMNNSKDYDMYREYAELVSANEMDKFYKSIEKNYPNLDGSDLKFLDDIKIERLKNKMVEQAAFFLSTANKDMEGFYEKLIASSTDESYKSELSTRYNQLKKLLPGMASANFRYEDVNGDFYTLHDLKGKFVYIDVWATWCGPCKQEIPALKELQKDLSNENIVFVSISVDQLKDKETWKRMVQNEELAGIQLFADNSFRSFFIKEYAIESIPRFILIDKKGLIVNADAPRPSGVGTKLYLQGILKEKGV